MGTFSSLAVSPKVRSAAAGRIFSSTMASTAPSMMAVPVADTASNLYTAS